MDSHQFGDPDPHKSEKSDPDPLSDPHDQQVDLDTHQSFKKLGAKRAKNRALEGLYAIGRGFTSL
jgi:hypothetical protein